MWPRQLLEHGQSLVQCRNFFSSSTPGCYVVQKEKGICRRTSLRPCWLPRLPFPHQPYRRFPEQGPAVAVEDEDEDACVARSTRRGTSSRVAAASGARLATQAHLHTTPEISSPETRFSVCVLGVPHPPSSLFFFFKKKISFRTMPSFVPCPATPCCCCLATTTRFPSVSGGAPLEALKDMDATGQCQAPTRRPAHPRLQGKVARKGESKQPRPMARIRHVPFSLIPPPSPTSHVMHRQGPRCAQASRLLQKQTGTHVLRLKGSGHGRDLRGGEARPGVFGVGVGVGGGGLDVGRA